MRVAVLVGVAVLRAHFGHAQEAVYPVGREDVRPTRNACNASGYYIRTGFLDPTGSGLHAGVDLFRSDTAASLQVRAILDGHVVVAREGCSDSGSNCRLPGGGVSCPRGTLPCGCNSGYGNVVVLRHGPMPSGPFFYSIYAHLKSGSISTAMVTVGSDVPARTVIGEVGNSGCTTASHLHFAIRNLEVSGVNTLGFAYLNDVGVQAARRCSIDGKLCSSEMACAMAGGTCNTVDSGANFEDPLQFIASRRVSPPPDLRPRITDLAPSTVLGENGPQRFVIFGENIDPNVSVTFRDLFLFEAPFECCVAGEPEYESSLKVVTMPNFTDAFSLWVVWLTNPGCQRSAPAGFFVFPP